MVWSPLIATRRVYRLLLAITSRFAALHQKYNCPFAKVLLSSPTLKRCSQMDFKGPHNNGKDLLTNRKDPWAESKDLKSLLLTNLFLPRVIVFLLRMIPRGKKGGHFSSTLISRREWIMTEWSQSSQWAQGDSSGLNNPTGLRWDLNPCSDPYIKPLTTTPQPYVLRHAF